MDDSYNNFDLIEDLPTNAQKPSEADNAMINMLFNDKSEASKNVRNEISDLMIMLILFIIFSIPAIDTFICNNVSIVNKSKYMLILIKGILFVLSFWVIKNFWLTRK